MGRHGAWRLDVAAAIATVGRPHVAGQLRRPRRPAARRRSRQQAGLPDRTARCVDGHAAGQPLWPGQSIVGGLLGGLIGVEMAKKLSQQTRSTGDAMVWPWCWASASAAWVASSPVCMTTPTALRPRCLGAWTLAMASRATRLQLYEIGMLMLLGTALHHLRARLATTPGLAFKLFLSSYLGWRFVVEFLKPVPVAYPLGLSGHQWTCLFALLLYLFSYGATRARPWSKHDPAKSAPTSSTTPRSPSAPPACAGRGQDPGQGRQGLHGQVVPAHGTERVLVSDDADYYRLCREVYVKPPEMPARFATPMQYGCPTTAACAPTTCSTAACPSSRSATTAICAAPPAMPARPRAHHAPQL